MRWIAGVLIPYFLDVGATGATAGDESDAFHPNVAVSVILTDIPLTIS